MSDVKTNENYEDVVLTKAIHLYLCTIWLYNLRDYISPEEHKKMERKWIEAFFEYQKAFSIFSGENIRLINSSGALRKCMKYVSYIKRHNI